MEGGGKRLFIDDITRVWIEYDRNTDTLYINFGEGEPDESMLVDDNIIVNTRGGTIISIIVTEFSKTSGGPC